MLASQFNTPPRIRRVKAACLMLLWAADPFARVYDKSDIRDCIQEQIQHFATLPQNEPSGVTVVANFNP